MEKLLRISQFAERTGKTQRTLRFYEEIGILFPKNRTNSGYRMYGEEALLQIKWIDKLHQMGFSLLEVQQFMQSLRQSTSGPDLMNVLRDFYQEQLLQTKKTISQLQNLVCELEQSIEYMNVCGQCNPKTPITRCKACDQHNEESPGLISIVTNSL